MEYLKRIWFRWQQEECVSRLCYYLIASYTDDTLFKIFKLSAYIKDSDPSKTSAMSITKVINKKGLWLLPYGTLEVVPVSMNSS